MFGRRRCQGVLTNPEMQCCLQGINGCSQLSDNLPPLENKNKIPKWILVTGGVALAIIIYQKYQ